MNRSRETHTDSPPNSVAAFFLMISSSSAAPVMTPCSERRLCVKDVSDVPAIWARSKVSMNNACIEKTHHHASFDRLKRDLQHLRRDWTSTLSKSAEMCSR